MSFDTFQNYTWLQNSNSLVDFFSFLYATVKSYGLPGQYNFFMQQHCNDLCYINRKRIVKFKSNQKNDVELDNFRWIGDIFLHNTFFQYQIIHVQHLTISNASLLN